MTGVNIESTIKYFKVPERVAIEAKKPGFFFCLLIGYIVDQRKVDYFFEELPTLALIIYNKIRPIVLKLYGLESLESLESLGKTFQKSSKTFKTLFFKTFGSPTNM